MRDINRIEPICGKIEQLWKTVPDWRFGQLISNLFGYVLDQTGGHDIFFIEDDKFVPILDKFIEYVTPVRGGAD